MILPVTGNSESMVIPVKYLRIGCTDPEFHFWTALLGNTTDPVKVEIPCIDTLLTLENPQILAIFRTPIILRLEFYSKHSSISQVMSSIAITPPIDCSTLVQASAARATDHPQGSEAFEQQLSKRLGEVTAAPRTIAGKLVFKATNWIDRVRGLPKRAIALPAAPPPSRAASVSSTRPTSSSS
ncbi:hypothetical protein EVG20_g8863 [Dentipellis fragilis]|uniref:Uncharacterized protein n=1 Tax=Dentipellis fragilis TaxID=205917 RepID=A0A4Y9Y2D0_9AGAM|nr:hypothetical protein EVG20_g8863 [Dentipellis fragilis]